MKQEIKEGTDNDIILSEMLADELEKARYTKSCRKILDDLNIISI
jgi:hypothetical protein